MILASVKPYYYYLIGEGKKKIEVRKSALKNLPQDIVFYMSKDENSFAQIPKEFQEKYRKHFGKVGLRVVCDKVDEIIPDYNPVTEKFFYGYVIDITPTCLSEEEIQNYGGNKPLYFWHISDLKIYDKPKKLDEFEHPCPYQGNCRSECQKGKFKNDGIFLCSNKITRPPQSYMKVKELWKRENKCQIGFAV